MSAVLDRLAEVDGGWQPEDVSQRICVLEPRIAIASDVHLPYTDRPLLDRFFDLVKDLHVGAVVWLGDLMDGTTYAKWDPDDQSASFERELRETEVVIRSAAELGVQQYWSYGNHEGRVITRMGKQIGMENLAHLCRVGDLVASGKLIVSDNPTLLYHPLSVLTRDSWLLTHPAQYGSSPLSVPGYLADLEQKNVIAGHAHHWGMGKSPSGRFTVVESGGLFEPRFMKYVVQRPSKHRAMCKGFVILDYGTPHLVDGDGAYSF